MTETLETSNVAATIARCCGRGRPRSDCARPARCGVRRQVAAFLPRRGERKHRGNWETFLPVSGTATVIVSSPAVSEEGESRSIKVNQAQSRLKKSRETQMPSPPRPPNRRAANCPSSVVLRRLEGSPPFKNQPPGNQIVVNRVNPG